MSDRALQRAHAAYCARRFDLVEQIVITALIDEPNNPALLITLAWAKLQTKAFAECRRFARCAIEVEPEYAPAYEILGWGVLQDASYVSSESHSGEPEHLGRLREARGCVSAAMAIDSQSSSLFHLKSEIERLSNNLPAALKAAEAGLAINPNDSACGNARMQIVLEMGRTTDAIRIGQGLLQIAPEDHHAHSLLSQCYLKAGQSSPALTHARQAVRLSPEDAGYRRTYWDAVAAQFALFRLLVRWQFFQSSTRRKFPKLFRLSYIGFILGTVAILEILKSNFRIKVPFSLFPIICGLSILLAHSERPCMLLVDWWMYFRNREFRAAMKSGDLAGETVTLAIICTILVGIALATADSWQWLAGAMLLLAYSGPILCFLYSTSWTARSAFLAQFMVMSALLGVSFHFESAEVHSTERFVFVYAMLGFVLVTIAGPCLYLHYRFEAQQKLAEEPWSNPKIH